MGGNGPIPTITPVMSERAWVHLLDPCLSRLASLEMSRRFALRADVSEEYKQRISEWMSKEANGFIVAFEISGDNKHIHAIINTDKKLKPLRSSFVRAFPECVGNKGYSLKECNDDFDAYIRYICKGNGKDDPPVIWSHQGLDYTDKAIEDAWRMYYVNQEAVIENAKKRKRVDGSNIVEQVEKICKERAITGNDRMEIARVYCHLMRDARKGINVFAGKAIVNTVSLLLDKCEAAETCLVYKIADI